MRVLRDHNILARLLYMLKALLHPLYYGVLVVHLAGSVGYRVRLTAA
jgi:hypothetical protein